MAQDFFDLRLLELVQVDSSQTAEQLSEKVALSPSSIQRRLRRMREAGIITRDIAVVDPSRVGKPMFYVVGLEVERERPELVAGLREWLFNQPRVQQVFYVTGDTDFVLIVSTPDIESFEGLMRRLVAENGNVRRFTTNVALSVIKRGLAIPVS